MERIEIRKFDIREATRNGELLIDGRRDSPNYLTNFSCLKEVIVVVDPVTALEVNEKKLKDLVLDFKRGLEGFFR